jgi:hypothetical protein
MRARSLVCCAVIWSCAAGCQQSSLAPTGVHAGPEAPGPGRGGELVLSLREDPPWNENVKGNCFVLRLTNESNAPIVLDARVLATPRVMTTVITSGKMVLPEIGIPPTPRELGPGDLFVLPPRQAKEIRFSLPAELYRRMDERRNLIFCYIDGQASPFSPAGRLSETWQGTAYSNCLVFDARLPVAGRK